jgi:hypothetical protein
MTNPRSSLAPFAKLSNEPDETLARAAAAKAWHETGIALFNPAWFFEWTDQKQVELLAIKLYGKRRV